MNLFNLPVGLNRRVLILWLVLILSGVWLGHSVLEQSEYGELKTVLFAWGSQVSAWMSLLAHTLTDESAKGYWYLCRVSGLVAYVWFGVSMVLGLLQSNKGLHSRIHPANLISLHEYASLLGWGFALLHPVLLLGDEYLRWDWVAVFVPWVASYSKTHTLALGQIGFYLLGLILLSYHVRTKIGIVAWKWLHIGAVLAYAAVTVHGLLTGSDTQQPWVLGMYILTNASVLLLVVYRLMSMHSKA